jgi:hypothetical protein
VITLSRQEWHGWRFPLVPKEFWLDKKNQMAFLEWFSQQKGIKSDADWKEVVHNDILKCGGYSRIVSDR